MKKIIQILPYSDHIHTWGLEKIAQTISDGLNKESQFSCLNIASDIRRWHAEPLEDFKTDTLFIPSFDLVYNFPIPKFWTKAFWSTIQRIKEYKPDSIQTHTRFFVQSMLGWIIAKWLWCKWVHIEHGSGFVTGYPWYIKICARLFDRTIGLWIFRQCDTIVTISQSHRAFIKKFTTKEPIVIYNPIDYIPKARIKNTIPHIGFVWSLLARKGVDTLIKALKKIEHTKRTCTIVGDGAEKKWLEALVNQLKLDDRIRFVWADDRANWLHRFDIFVNPSYQEWLPTTVVEALIAGCVVVATDVWGTREISDWEDLILIQSWSIAMLSKKLAGILKNSIKSASIMKKFLPTLALSQYTALYKEIIHWK